MDSEQPGTFLKNLEAASNDFVGPTQGIPRGTHPKLDLLDWRRSDTSSDWWPTQDFWIQNKQHQTRALDVLLTVTPRIPPPNPVPGGRLGHGITSSTTEIDLA